MKWGGFQPFSSRPLIAATYVAGTFLDDDRRSIQIVEDAPRLHRNDPLFANNYACALARRGRLEEAERTLRSIDPSNLSESDRLSLLATRGLIRLRAGQLDEGREYYKEAMRGFGSIREPQHVAVAAYFWASEEKRMGTELAPTFIEEAKALLHRVGLLELEDLAKKL